jgi:hypothetical protein
MLEARYPLIPEPVERNWLERNPRWKIPLGLLLILLLGSVFSTPGLLVSQREIQSSGAFQDALARAQASPEVTEALGPSWKPGVWTWGRFKSGDDYGFAQLSIPVSGPKESGKILVCARKVGNRWILQSLCLTISNRRTLDLLLAESPSLAPQLQQ